MSAEQIALSIFLLQKSVSSIEDERVVRPVSHHRCDQSRLSWGVIHATSQFSERASCKLRTTCQPVLVSKLQRVRFRVRDK